MGRLGMYIAHMYIHQHILKLLKACYKIQFLHKVGLSSFVIIVTKNIMISKVRNTSILIVKLVLCFALVSVYHYKLHLVIMIVVSINISIIN